MIVHVFQELLNHYVKVQGQVISQVKPHSIIVCNANEMFVVHR